MPAYARQGITVISNKKKKKNPTIVLIKKTGYQNVWINGQHFYYNVHEQYDDIADTDFERLAQNTHNEGKRLIVIRRK